MAPLASWATRPTPAHDSSIASTTTNVITNDHLPPSSMTRKTAQSQSQDYGLSAIMAEAGAGARRPTRPFGGALGAGEQDGTTGLGGFVLLLPTAVKAAAAVCRANHAARCALWLSRSSKFIEVNLDA